MGSRKADGSEELFIACLMVVWVWSWCATVSASDPPPTVTFVASDWVPFCQVDADGKPKGVYIDMLKEIFKNELGMHLEYKQMPWKRAQVFVANGKGDLLVTIATPERLEYTFQSELPLLEMYLQVFSYRDHPRLDEIHTITSGKDIKRMGLIPVTNLGNHWHKINIDSFDVATHYVSEEENAFRVLAGKRADISIEPLIVGTHLIKKLNLSSKVVPTRARFGPIVFHLLVGKRSPVAPKMERINAIIERLRRSGRLEQILHGYEVID